jgi:hypothetical protein
MGFNPQEVINAYMGGKINYAPGGMSVYGTSAGAGATATPEEEEEVLERQRELEKLRPSVFSGTRKKKKFEEAMEDFQETTPFEILNMPNSYFRPGVEKFTDDEGNFIMPIKKAAPDRGVLTYTDDKTGEEKTKVIKRSKAKKDKDKSDVQDKIKDADAEKQRLLAEQEEQRKAALLAAQQEQNQKQYDVGGGMYNALMENILGLVGREKTDLEKYTDALKAGAAGARGFDVVMGNVGREDAQKIIDTGISDLSSI